MHYERDESGTWTGSAKSTQLKEEEENLEQEAAGAHRGRSGEERSEDIDSKQAG